ncbi:1424_t:CDS:1, partial [Racocetra persica]
SGITELGKVHFIITGNFFQLPPASDGMYFLNKEWYNNKSSGLLRDSWKSLDLVYVKLTEIFRQNDPEFKHHCTNLRYGFLNKDTFQYLKKCNYLEDDA